MKPGNPFFQMASPKLVPYSGVPMGMTFVHNDTEFVKLAAGHRQLKGRHPNKPHTLPPGTLVEI